MAYSDYGGYAYKNGERVAERSDAVLSPDGVKSTPGMWPGWFIQEGRSGGSYHALLGDGPIFVGLYKQSSLSIRPRPQTAMTIETKFSNGDTVLAITSQGVVFQTVVGVKVFDGEDGLNVSYKLLNPFTTDTEWFPESMVFADAGTLRREIGDMADLAVVRAVAEL